MISQPFEHQTTDDDRVEPRTHLFVVAALGGEGGSSPVHIRNMSPTGALIEAPVLPKPGSRVTLKRGSLAVNGRVAWRSERKAGISFDSTVFVADWMSRRPVAHQDRVDRLVDALRNLGGAVNIGTPTAEFSIEEELNLLKSDLAELGNHLSGDTILVVTHPEIQLLDIATQRVDRILGHLKSASGPLLPA